MKSWSEFWKFCVCYKSLFFTGIAAKSLLPETSSNHLFRFTFEDSSGDDSFKFI